MIPPFLADVLSCKWQKWVNFHRYLSVVVKYTQNYPIYMCYWTMCSSNVVITMVLLHRNKVATTFWWVRWLGVRENQDFSGHTQVWCHQGNIKTQHYCSNPSCVGCITPNNNITISVFVMESQQAVRYQLWLGSSHSRGPTMARYTSVNNWHWLCVSPWTGNTW